MQRYVNPTSGSHTDTIFPTWMSFPLSCSHPGLISVADLEFRQPQRPRAMPAPGNENLMVRPHTAHGVDKTLASTTAGGLKIATRRTAFGDVSNTAKTFVSVPDDFNAAKRRPVVATDNKENIASHSAKDAFLRPAQRPAKGTS